MFIQRFNLNTSLLGVGLALIVFILVLGMLQKQKLIIERRVAIHKSLKDVYSLLADFGQFQLWNNLLHQDENAITRITGNTGEVGEKLTWSGNRKIGKGYMLVIEKEDLSKLVLETKFGGNTIAKYSYSTKFDEDLTLVGIHFELDCGINPLARLKARMISKHIAKDIEKNLENIQRIANETF